MRLLCLILLSIVMIPFQNCTEGFAPIGDGLAAQSRGPIEGLELGALQRETVNLLSTREIIAQVNSLNGYSGDVNLSLDRTMLDLVEGASTDVTVTLEPEVVSVPANGSAEYKIIVTTKSSAPSFDVSTIKVSAEAEDGMAFPVEADHELSIRAFVEINMLGRDVNPANRWREEADLDFRVHTGGLTVRVNNLDTREGHILHGNASIPHGDRDNPLPASPDGVTVAGFDEFVIPPDETRVGTYYHHDFENNGDRRSLRFNRTPEQLLQAQGLRTLASISEVKKAPELMAEEGNPAHCTNH